mmetsp:Transcript_17367/g.40506  ORF Transcript_17367/g.40506 Transcript_17367/m.40506 type:complete len:200 (+) Transcript_17367:238-837(+)
MPNLSNLCFFLSSNSAPGSPAPKRAALFFFSSSSASWLTAALATAALAAVLLTCSPITLTGGNSLSASFANCPADSEPNRCARFLNLSSSASAAVEPPPARAKRSARCFIFSWRFASGSAVPKRLALSAFRASSADAGGVVPKRLARSALRSSSAASADIVPKRLARSAFFCSSSVMGMLQLPRCFCSQLVLVHRAQMA